ncbi:TraX family protein [Pseudolactococcus yaeyamensis]
MSILKRGLTSFDLKLIGIILMVFDHIHQMFYFEGIPLWFTMLGRLVAPIFLFLSAEGFHYTRNRKKYMLSLLIGFWICQIVFMFIPAILPNPRVELINTIFGTLFLGLCAMWIYDGFFGKVKYIGKAILGLLFLVLTPFITLVVIGSQELPLLIKQTFIFFIPNAVTVEGGPIFILLALLFHIFRDKKLGAYLALALVSLFIFISNPHQEQWMMLFSLIPIYLYNGKEGRKEKWLFYIFYPLHIIVLYLLSTLFFL